jgi:hypothetical protein
MHKSRLGALVVDCQSDNLAEQARFWGPALGTKPESQKGQINSKYIRLNGAPSEVQVLLQKVEHPSRVHFDIETDDIDAEVRRLEAAGASVVERLEKWVVMEAPSKHRFCVIEPIRSDFEENSNVWK